MAYQHKLLKRALLLQIETNRSDWFQFQTGQPVKQSQRKIEKQYIAITIAGHYNPTK